MKRGTNPRNAKGQFTSEKKYKNSALENANALVNLFYEMSKFTAACLKKKEEKLENPKTTWTYGPSETIFYGMHGGSTQPEPKECKHESDDGFYWGDDDWGYKYCPDCGKELK